MVKKKSAWVIEIPDFRRAADQRLKAARYLLETEEFRLEAVYLAGYVVECAFKSLILKRTTSPRRQQDWMRKFLADGDKSHGAEYLRTILVKNLIIPLSVEFMDHFRPLSTEGNFTDLRYKAGRRDRTDAKRFIDAAEWMLDWTMRSS